MAFNSNYVSSLYQNLAEENRLKMISSYFALKKYDEYVKPKDKILKNIDYSNKDGINNGIKEMYNLAMKTDNDYLSRGYDIDIISECIEIWEEYYKLKDLLESNFTNV